MSRLGAKGVTASTIGNYAMVLGQAVRTLIVARILGPASFGILNIANVGTNFSTYADMGTSTVGQQEASEARGRGEHELAQQRLREMAQARMFPALVLSGLLAVVAGGLATAGNGSQALAILFVCISGLLQSVWFSARGWLRVEGAFRLASWAQIGQVAVWLVLVPLAAWRWQLLGSLCALALSYLPPTLIAARRCPLGVLLVPSHTQFRRLLARGLPVWALMVSSFVMLNVDQVLAGTLLGDHALGLYAIGMLTANALMALSDGAAAAAHPQTLETHARLGHLPRDLPSVVRIMHVVEAVFGALVPASWLGMAFIAQFFLVDYREALPVVAVIAVASALIGIPTASNAALLAVGLHRRVPALFIMGMLITVMGSVALVRVWPSVLSIAAASLLGTVCYAVAYLRLVAQALGRQDVVRFILTHVQGTMILAVAAALACVAYARWGMSGYWIASAAAFVIGGVSHAVAFRYVSRALAEGLPAEELLPDAERS